MKTTSFVAFASLLLNAGFAAANNAESVLENEFGLTSVTTGTALTSLATALQSAASSMRTRSDLISALSVLETAVPASVASSISEHGLHYITSSAAPSWFTHLPKDVQSQLYSAQSVEWSIETKILKISSTASEAGAAAPTAAALGFAGAAAAGLLGVAAML